MCESSLASIFNVHRQFLVTDRIVSYKKSSIEKQKSKFKEEASQLVITLHRSSKALSYVFKLTEDNVEDVKNSIDSIPSRVDASVNDDIFERILATVPMIHDQIFTAIQESTESILSSIASIFGFFWCNELTNEFLDVLMQSPEQVVYLLASCLVFHPQIQIYIKLIFEPVLKDPFAYNTDVMLAKVKETMVRNSHQIPDVLKSIAMKFQHPGKLLWVSILSRIVSNPFIFNICSFSAELTYASLMDQVRQTLDQFFCSEEGSQFIKDMSSDTTLSPRSPSLELLSSVTKTPCHFLVLDEDDEELLKMLVDLPECRGQFYLVKSVAPASAPEPLSVVPLLDDKIISILKKVYPMQCIDTGTALDCIRDLVFLNDKVLGAELDAIAEDLSKMDTTELIGIVQQKTNRINKEMEKEMLETIVKYSSQTELINNITSFSLSILNNCTFLADIQSLKKHVLELWNSDLPCPGIEDIVDDPMLLVQHFERLKEATLAPSNKMLAILILHRINACSYFGSSSSQSSKDFAVTQLYSVPITELVDCGTEPLTTYAEQPTKLLSALQVISTLTPPMDIADNIIHSVHALSSLLMDDAGSDVGADHFLSTVTIAIYHQKVDFLASLRSFFDIFIFPIHSLHPLFDNLDYYFLSTFFSCVDVIIEKSETFFLDGDRTHDPSPK